jgi:hypothetical protein
MSHRGRQLARPTVKASGLPTLIMPCPRCGGRLVFKGTAQEVGYLDFEDITYACNRCATEMVRTVKPLRDVV